MTDDAQIAVNTYSYDAFGSSIAQTGTTANKYLYTGEQFDPSLRLYNLRSRYYDPTISRFVTMDIYPGANYDPASLHKYLYCHNDPINKLDPRALAT